MDADRLLLGLFLAAVGYLSGYLHGRRHNTEEIDTLRGIVQDNQRSNYERMMKTRSSHHDETQ